MNLRISIIIAITALTLLNFHLNRGDMADAVGRTLGASFVSFGIAYLYARKRSEKTKTIAFTIAILMLFPSSIVRIIEKSAEDKALKDLQGLMEVSTDRLESQISGVEPKAELNASFETADTTSNNSTKLQKITDAAKKYTAAENKLVEEFDNKIRTINIGEKLENMQLRTSLAGIGAVRSSINDYETVYKDFQADHLKITNDYKDKIRSISTDGEYVNFSSSFNKSQEANTELYELEVKILNEQRNLLNLIEPYAAFNQISINEDGLIILPDDSIIKKYNDKAKIIDGYFERQQFLRQEFLKRKKDMLEKLKSVTQKN